MAATGLGGFNPYGKTQAIDISSKPLNALLQVRQKQLAKSEALDKYFQEYDKTINPAGMRTQDVDALVRLKNEAKQFYFQNKEAIQNTSKDNGRAYSQLMNMYNEASKAIEQSKQQAATGKVVTQAYLDAKKNNRIIPEEIQDAIFASQLSIKDPNYRPFDPINFDAYDRHDAVKYAQNIYSKIKPSEGLPEKQIDKATGAEFYKTEKKITKDALGLIEMEAMNALGKDRGFRFELEDIMKDQNKVNQLAAEYKNFTGKNMPKTEKDLAVAYTIALRPQAEVSYTKPDNWYQKLLVSDRMIREREKSKSNNPVTFLKEGIDYLQAGDPVAANQYFSKWAAQGKTDITGKRVGFQNIEFLPGGKAKVNFTTPISKDGAIVGVPASRTLDLNSPSLLVELGNLHQTLLGSDAKMEKEILATPVSSPNLRLEAGGAKSAPKVETLAEKMRRLKTQKTK